MTTEFIKDKTGPEIFTAPVLSITKAAWIAVIIIDDRSTEILVWEAAPKRTACVILEPTRVPFCICTITFMTAEAEISTDEYAVVPPESVKFERVQFTNTFVTGKEGVVDVMRMPRFIVE